MWHGDALWYENYLGKRSIEFNVDFDYNSQYRICSNSKLFTAVAIMQLVERGAIASVDNPINMYIDQADLLAWGFPEGTDVFCPKLYNSTDDACQNITFTSLLSMTSGIVAAITCTYKPSQWQYQFCYPLEAVLVYPGSIAQVVALFARNPLQAVPGPRYGPNVTNNYYYTNENFVLLSYFVEKLSGLSLREYYQTYIFDIIGMDSTTYDPFSQAFSILPNPVSEYFFYTDTNVSTTPFAYGSCTSVEVSPGAQAGSGGIISTVPDMVHAIGAM